MEYLKALVLGLVQGITEFLPISSTAHVKVVPVLLGWGDPGASFAAAIQLGSVAAVLWYFWTDLAQIAIGSVRAIRKANYDALELRLAIGIILGTIPIVIGGLYIKLFVTDYDNSPLRSVAAIAIASIVMALLLALAEKVGLRKRRLNNITIMDALWIGLAEMLAIIPGVSRSGSTLTAGLFLGLERAPAARFSFLLGTPAILIAGLVELEAMFDSGFGDMGAGAFGVAMIASLVSSYLAIAWLLKFFQTQSTWVFVWYRLGFGLLLLILLGLGYVS
ncbi:Undecaprenyl-diphosphatase [Thalassoporum mexicanum PCC 7367]|uniref:undecaprenyl-diphosphate phosphatase n=1 Tax=Thalassoporum mexicanum TaxID=3457544 RepID=UPI00029FA5E6|nr:undecaprenyl-diphosphate phosphatase [Pseudanabaena sp. PCC 7367]AFY70763.1 Undecaprenyl-diphosphatase [Pseudanabaena sp. PCC 7367]